MGLRWFEFFDAVYARRDEFVALGVCPYGTKCAPSGWSCCSHTKRAPASGVTVLPQESSWIRANGDWMPKGCDGCAERKTLLCALWPVVPYTNVDGEIGVMFLFQCEAFVAVPRAYLKHVQFALHVSQLLCGPFVDLRGTFMDEVERVLTLVHGGGVAILNRDGALAALNDPNCVLAHAMMRTVPVNGVSNRHLEVADNWRCASDDKRSSSKAE